MPDGAEVDARVVGAQRLAVAVVDHGHNPADDLPVAIVFGSILGWQGAQRGGSSEWLFGRFAEVREKPFRR
jgi:hypothetical protein